MLLAAVLPLAGCMAAEPGALGFLSSGSEPATRDALRKVQMYEGDVVVRGPAGYCIDRRTLHRRLSREGLTFSGLLHDVRREVAQQYVVSPDRSMAEIALLVGFAGGRIAEVKTNMPLIKGFSIVGVRAGEFGRRDPEGGRRVRETIWRRLAAGETRSLVHAEFALADWRKAFELMRGRGLVGKVVLKP